MSSSHVWRLMGCVAVLLLSLLFALPTFISPDSAIASYLPQRRVNLGLDLRGGASLLLEVEASAYQQDLLRNYYSDVRKELASHKIAVQSIVVDPADSAIKVMAASEKLDSVLKVLRTVMPEELEIKKVSGAVVVRLTDDFIKQKNKDLLMQTMEIVRRRVDEKGTKEIDLQLQGSEYILLQVPGMKDPGELKRLLGKTAKLSFHLVAFTQAEVEALGAGARMLSFDDGSGSLRHKLMVQAKPIVSGEMLIDAKVGVHEGSPVVNFKLNSMGARLFAEHSSRNIGRPFAIVLDGMVLSAPVVREPILGGSGQISGSFSMASANELALLLRAGALPAPIKIVQERTIGPSLGADSIASGINAMMVGGISVIVLMFLIYYKFGLIANLALVLNVVLMVAVLAIFDATLTLPGIAGMVLTLGMAVDANVLILERIREEVAAGRTFSQAVRVGYDMAQATIIDSNLTTVLAGVILYLFGLGPVRGFAVTLVIGILCSMFTAVTVTRLITELLLRRGVNLKVSI